MAFLNKMSLWEKSKLVANKTKNVWNNASGMRKTIGGAARELSGLPDMGKALTAFKAGKASLGGTALKMGLATLTPALSGYFIYQGFKEGGLSGGAQAIGMELLFTHTGMAAIGTPIMAGLAFGTLGAGAIYGAYKYSQDPTNLTARGLLRGQTAAYRKKNAQLDLGSPIVDTFGNIATMRARSLQQISNSRLNGRNMLGNEASMLY